MFGGVADFPLDSSTTVAPSQNRDPHRNAHNRDATLAADCFDGRLAPTQLDLDGDVAADDTQDVMNLASMPGPPVPLTSQSMLQVLQYYWGFQSL